jgi:hypothetical protein
MSQKVKETFFSESNEQMLDRLLYSDVQRRIGSTLNEKQKQRLVKTVKHYMTEVYRVNSKENSIQILNKEVLTSVVPDYMGYLRRQKDLESNEGSEAEIVNSMDPLRTDVGTRFALMQDARNETKSKPPSPPDFRIPLEEEAPAALDLFEQVKRLRESEAARDAKAAEDKRIVESAALRPIEAGAIIRAKSIDQEASALSMPPDLRSVLFGSTKIDRTPYRQSQSGLAEANPTIAVPQVNTNRPVLPQDFVQREDDVVNYKENEFNFFAYSADRNWIVNTGENRYNFSVLFNPGNPTGTMYRNNLATQLNFKNITRIELVKVLIPVEGLDILIDVSGSATTNTTVVNTNALSFPYLMVNIPELDTNSAGTNYNLDKSFGVIQYDANWISDNNIPQRGGYLAMIPKFMKCQKVYYPTPLSTLQKMSIRIQRPDGSLLSTSPDSLTINTFALSLFVNGAAAGGNLYITAAGASTYIWIETSKYFSRFSFNKGDRIVVQNVNFSAAVLATAGLGTAAADFINYITNPNGLLVVNIGVKTAAPLYSVGPNAVGYANCIIVDARYNDPTTGSVALAPFGGSATVEGVLNTAISNVSTAVSSGALLNLNHQVQCVFRIITRDMDSASRLRPDNLN